MSYNLVKQTIYKGYIVSTSTYIQIPCVCRHSTVYVAHADHYVSRCSCTVDDGPRFDTAFLWLSYRSIYVWHTLGALSHPASTMPDSFTGEQQCIDADMLVRLSQPTHCPYPSLSIMHLFNTTNVRCPLIQTTHTAQKLFSNASQRDCNRCICARYQPCLTRLKL